MAPDFMPASAPSFPVTMLRTSWSLPTHIITSSAPRAASPGVAAALPPYCATQLWAFAGVRLKTVTRCPARARWPAIGKPITPRPRKAMSLLIEAPCGFVIVRIRCCRMRVNCPSRVEASPRGGNRRADLRRRRPARMIPARDRCFQGKRVFHVGTRLRREAPEILERQAGEVDTFALGIAHGARDRFVRIAKRHALADEVVGEVGRRGVAFARCLAHALHVRRDP